MFSSAHLYSWKYIFVPANVYGRKINLSFAIKLLKMYLKENKKNTYKRQMYTLKYLIYNTTGLNISEVFHNQ